MTKEKTANNWGKARTSISGEVSEQLSILQAKLAQAWGFQPTMTQTMLFAIAEANKVLK